MARTSIISHMERLDRAESALIELLAHTKEDLARKREVDAQRQRLDYAYQPSQVALAAPNASGLLYELPQGVSWTGRRVAVTGPANAQVIIYLGSPNPAFMVEAIILNANGVYSDAFSNDLHIPEGSKVYASGSIAGTYTFNTLVKRYRRHLNLTPSTGIVLEETIEDIETQIDS